MKKILITAMGTLFLLCGSVAAQPLMDGDFAIGNTSWTLTTGSSGLSDTSTTGFGQASTPANAGNPASTAAQIEGDFSLTPGTISTIVPGGGDNRGSGFFQSFTAAAGDVITFDFSFNADLLGNDLGFASLVFDPGGANTLVGGTASANSTVSNGIIVVNTLPGLPVNAGGSWFINTAGTYLLGFAIVNTVDANFTANFTVDTVQQMASVPEIDTNAAALPLATLVILFLAIGDGQRRRLSGLA